MSTREEKLQAACEMVLMFYKVNLWSPEDMKHWRMLSKIATGHDGHQSATSKALCDAVRVAMKTDE